MTTPKKSTPIKKIISSEKLIPTKKEVDNVAVEVEMENENTKPKNVNTPNKPKEPPNKDHKINDDMNELILGLLKI